MIIPFKFSKAEIEKMVEVGRETGVHCPYGNGAGSAYIVEDTTRNIQWKIEVRGSIVEIKHTSTDNETAKASLKAYFGIEK